MNADRLRHAVLIATLVLSSFAFANGARSSALAAQDDPPDCGASDWIEENSESNPEHVFRLENDVDLTTIEGVGLLFISITSTVCIDPNTSIDGHNDPGHQPLLQIGTATVTVLEGSLSVIVVSLCSTPGCAESDGGARIRLAGDATWTDIAVGAPATVVEAGDTIVLSNVTVEMTSGSEKTVIASSGGYTFNPGGGCPSSCWQVP